MVRKGLIALVLMLAVGMFGAYQASALTWTSTSTPTGTPAYTHGINCPCPNFVDEDHDGICDRAEEHAPHYGPMNQNCPGFVDEDHDGICDRAEEHAPHYGSACQNCPGFVDEDHDGICDRAEEMAHHHGPCPGCHNRWHK